MRRLMMMVVAVGVTAGLLVGCAKQAAPTTPATPKATTAAPAKK
ncbi:MAG TPA: hypothetical protein VNE39_08085 [Planctomycetota bacterium]|nr:hypothetical protein [Planctomycetota bacterium]